MDHFTCLPFTHFNWPGFGFLCVFLFNIVIKSTIYESNIYRLYLTKIITFGAYISFISAIFSQVKLEDVTRAREQQRDQRIQVCSRTIQELVLRAKTSFKRLKGFAKS